MSRRVTHLTTNPIPVPRGKQAWTRGQLPGLQVGLGRVTMCGNRGHMAIGGWTSTWQTRKQIPQAHS